MVNTKFHKEYIENNESLKDFRKYNGEELCKYYALNYNSVDALINGYLYAARKDQMNDIRENSFADDYSKTEKLKLHSNTSGLTGIISLTESVSDFPYFSYYTQDKGFCVVFKNEILSREEIGIPLNVKYSDELPRNSFRLNRGELLINEIVKDRYRKESISSFLTKPNKWKNEEEWRILVDYEVNKIFEKRTSDGDVYRVEVKKGAERQYYDISYIKEVRIARNLFINKFDDEEKNKWKIEKKVIIDLKIRNLKSKNIKPKKTSTYRDYEYQSELNKRFELNLKHYFLVFVKENNIKLKWVGLEDNSFKEKYFDFHYEYDIKNRKLTIYNPKFIKEHI